MINKVKKIKKKYIVLFLIFVLLLITPFTYSKYTSKYTKHITISAVKPEYMVIFDSNNGEGLTETQSFEFGTPQNLRINTFTKEGYVFLNWNTSPDGKGTSYEDEVEVTDLTRNETITLYAIYVREKYIHKGDITFDGTNYIDTNIFLFSEENINNDFEVSFEIKERGSNSGYNAGNYPTIMSSMSEKGWPYPGVVYRMYSDWDDQIVINWSGANREDYNNTFHLDGKKKVTLKRINGAIYLNLNDEGDVQLLDVSSMQYKFDDYPVTFGAGLDSNYNPQRWFKGTLSNLKVIVKDPDTEIGTINFYPNYEGGNSLAQHVSPNTTYNLMKNKFTREGYIFTGWNTKPDGSGDKYQDEQEITTNLVGCGQRVNLYAQWKTYKYTVVFDANNGTGDKVRQEFDSAVSTNLMQNSFETTGLTFAFWTTGQNGSGDVYQDGETVENLGIEENQEIRLYANYEQFSYKDDGPITFNGISDYINTHIYLFSEKNVNKNFEISFEITDYENTKNYNTIVSSLDESGDPYPGFVFRINDSTEISNGSQEYNLEANASTSRESNNTYDLSTKIVVIKREGGILKLQLDGKEVTQIIDYQTLARSFYYPLTVGASLNNEFEPWRHFKGTISKLNITLSETSESTGEQTESGGEEQNS